MRLDGREVPVNLVGIPITDRGANGILVCMHDLTEQERSLELFRSVSESVADAIVTCDESGVIVTANSATSRLFGYPSSELVGNTIGVLMPETYRNELHGYFANYLQTDVAKVVGFVREFQARRMDATHFPIELTVSEFRLNGKRHFTGVIRDTTERKRLENQFLQSQKMDAVGKLAGGVAHDFNNLLTVIIGYGNLILAEMPANAPRREAIAAILDAGERAARLTQQLLAFSRSVVVEMKIIDLNLFVEKMAQMLRRLIEEDISLTLTLAPKVSPIKAPPGQLEQLIMNMVVNARDSMSSGGQLRIQTRNYTLQNADQATYPDLTPGKYVELSISDTGVGMKDEITSKIFEPFFTTKEVGKGTGLGLSVVHGVVKQCGGGISLESKVGVGTTFRILFPAESEAAMSSEPSPAPRSFKGQETILVVEDEIAVGKIVKSGLEANGYKVLQANGGQEAIQLAANFPGTIDLLLTDVVMPEMSGQKVAEAIRLQRPGIRVIYMSGYANEVVFRRGVTETTDEFLQKPFTTVGLTRTVRTVLDANPR